MSNPKIRELSIDRFQLDMSNRLRVSEIYPLGDLRVKNDKSPRLFDEKGTGTSTHSSDDAHVDMSVGSGQYLVRQSWMFFPYFSGKSQLIEMTFSGMSHQSGITKRVGYFTASTSSPYNSNRDGIWLESDGSQYTLNVSKLGSLFLNQAQSDWNLDKLNGAGGDENPSEILLDLDNFSIFVFDFLWLGGKGVRFGFVINNKIIWCHEYAHSNYEQTVMFSSPNKPIRYEIRSAGGGATGSMQQICSTVASEGSITDIGYRTSFDTNNAISVSSTSLFYPLLGWRLKTTHLDVATIVEKISMLSTSNDNFLYRLYLNPTLSGSLTFNPITDSPIEYAIGNGTVNVTSPGHQWDGAPIYTNSTTIDIPKPASRIGSGIDGTRDELWLCVKPLTTNMNVLASVTIRDLF